jgi:mannitol/fructose-specific phosphotransferase system IIA component (Ntr-type)
MNVSDTLSLVSILRPETVVVGLQGESKTEVIEKLVSLLDGVPAVTDLEGVLEDVLAREELMSTGVGMGLGVPHARTDAVSETVAALAVTRNPVPFDSVDHEPVRLLFLLVGPKEERSRHVQLLGRLTRLVSSTDFRSRLMEAVDSVQALAIVQEEEERLG